MKVTLGKTEEKELFNRRLCTGIDYGKVRRGTEGQQLTIDGPENVSTIKNDRDKRK